jgi:hypothetical protein
MSKRKTQASKQVVVARSKVKVLTTSAADLLEPIAVATHLGQAPG